MKTIFMTLALLCLHLFGTTAALAATSTQTGKAGDSVVLQCEAGSTVRAIVENNQATIGCVATTMQAAAAPPKPAPVAAPPVYDADHNLCPEGHDRIAKWVQTRSTPQPGTWATDLNAYYEITAVSAPVCKGKKYPEESKSTIRVPVGTKVPSYFLNMQVNGPFYPGSGKTNNMR